MWSACTHSGSVNYFYVGLQVMNCSGIARRQQYWNIYWNVKLNAPKIVHCIKIAIRSNAIEVNSDCSLRVSGIWHTASRLFELHTWKSTVSTILLSLCWTLLSSGRLQYKVENELLQKSIRQKSGANLHVPRRCWPGHVLADKLVQTCTHYIFNEIVFYAMIVMRWKLTKIQLYCSLSLNSSASIYSE